MGRGRFNFHSRVLGRLGLLTRGGTVKSAFVNGHLCRRSEAKPDWGMGQDVTLGPDVVRCNARARGGVEEGVERGVC